VEYSIIPDSSSEIIGDIIELSNADSFANLILERKKIRIGEDVGDKLEDPIWRVLDDTDDTDDEEESDLARTNTISTLEPRAQVFVDEFYTVLAEVMDEDFEEEFPEEYMRLVLVEQEDIDFRFQDIPRRSLMARTSDCICRNCIAYPG